MPNWVFNDLTIEGNIAEIKDLKEQMNRPFKVLHDKFDTETKEYEKKYTEYSKPIFAFHNIYSHLEDGITDEEYNKQPARSELDVNDKGWWADTERLRLTDKSWYSWNITNWGVKWDVAVNDDEKYPNTELITDTKDTLLYRFHTAWSIPDEAMIKLSEQYPTLNFTLSYEEETGWGGERQYLNGECVSESEYGWQCRECNNQEDETPWCDDCEFDVCPDCGYNEAYEICEEHQK